jgi:hypothetical protein
VCTVASLLVLVAERELPALEGLLACTLVHPGWVWRAERHLDIRSAEDGVAIPAAW